MGPLNEDQDEDLCYYRVTAMNNNLSFVNEKTFELSTFVSSINDVEFNVSLQIDLKLLILYFKQVNLLLYISPDNYTLSTLIIIFTPS